MEKVAFRLKIFQIEKKQRKSLGTKNRKQKLPKDLTFDFPIQFMHFENCPVHPNFKTQDCKTTQYSSLKIVDSPKSSVSWKSHAQAVMNQVAIRLKIFHSKEGVLSPKSRKQ